jgi:hypothetical protein
VTYCTLFYTRIHLTHKGKEEKDAASYEEKKLVNYKNKEKLLNYKNKENLQSQRFEMLTT